MIDIGSSNTNHDFNFWGNLGSPKNLNKIKSIDFLNYIHNMSSSILRSLTLTSTQFFNKLKAKEYDFYPFTQLSARSFNLPSIWLSCEIPERDLIQIISDLGDCIIVYYLPVDLGEYTWGNRDKRPSLNQYEIDYEKGIISFIGESSQEIIKLSFEFKD